MPILCQSVMEGATTMIRVDDPKELMKLVSFMVMGDGGVYKGKLNYKFIMNMRSKNFDYINKCSDILQNITSTNMFKRPMPLVHKDGSHRQPQTRLESGCHPYFTAIRDRIYTGKYKGIDPHALKLLDYEALSFLYMSDGCYYRRPAENIPRGKQDEHKVTLNCKRLCYGDQLLLKKALKDKLDLEWNINRNQGYYYLKLRAKDVDKFMENIAKYITPSFQYKLKEQYRTVSSENKISEGDMVCTAEETEPAELDRNDQAIINNNIT